VQERKLDNIY